jgi:hypothetical protein
MSSEIILMLATAPNRQRGAVVEMQNGNFRAWPEKPSGTAEKSERGQGLNLAPANTWELPEINEIYLSAVQSERMGEARRCVDLRRLLQRRRCDPRNARGRGRGLTRD